VKKITPVITFGLAPSPAYSDNFVVSAATSNTDSRALTYGWISGPCAGVSVSTFTATGVGTCVVQALGAESTNFFTGSQTQSVTIGRMTPNLTWTAPTDIPYGTALSATQLNAAIGGGVPGTLSYTPAAGAILPVGTSLLTVEFTPTDSTLYDGATKKVNLEVSAPSAPVITGLSLDIGPTTGDSPVIISGTNLYNGKVTFGGVSGACSVDSITQITCTTPVHSLGSVNVEIVTPGGTTAPNQLFTYVQTTMLGISPSQGPVTGGTTVILSGVQKFITASFGGTTAACTSISNNQIRCVTPAHAAGQVDVIVTTGYAELTAANGFTYVPAPKAQVSPGSGPVTSGTSIIITGTGFDNTTAVTFGGSAASCSLVSSTEMNCTAPPHAAGTVNVKIVNAGAAEYIDAFTYVEAYFSANIKPSFGLMSGGTTVTINDGTGTDFTGATAVTFGGTNVASFTIVSATKISVVSPAHTSGMVDIVISTPSGTVTYADGFTFSGTTPLLTLDSVSLDGSITFASDSPSQLTIKFNMALMNVPDGDPNWPYSAINPENYLLYSSGLNGIFETQSCQDGLQGDDEQVLTDSDSYDPASYTVTITVNAGLPLPTNAYQLLVCGTTSIKSTTGVKLNSGLEDALFRFAIVADPLVNSKLPETGFAPNRITILPAQDQAYTTMADLWLEIPTIDVKMNIVGVPQSTDSWDILWLGKDAGYLEGSAYPTHPGNSVLTGHVWDSFNRPGPFANLSKLKYGDQIKIHLSGQVYTYEVRENKLIRPGDVNAAMKHEELSWVTLLTCDSYQAGTDSYTYRRIVRAVLIDFK
jgi:LPXTG-site transpeptidase (sortase) family protein